MKMDGKIKLGKWGETLAADYLSAHGVSIVAMNARTYYGELDVVGCVEGMTVIFEVKTRKTDTYGNPEDAISRIKRRHLINAGMAFIQDHPELPKEWRIDVIAIRLFAGSPPEIKWFVNAVS
jgi:putative endonuclease